MSTIRQSASDIYRKTTLESWIIGLLSGFLVSGLIGLGFLSFLLTLVAVPLICLPIIFAAHLSHYGARFGRELTFTGMMKQFALYFRRPFSSSFSFFPSFLKALITFFIAQTIFAVIGFYIVSYINPNLMDSMNQFLEVYNNSVDMTLDTLDELLLANDGALLLFVAVSEIPAFTVAFMVFAYFASRSSVGVFIRLNTPSNNTQFIRVVQADATRRNRRAMMKDYWSLNWPLFVLMLLGAAGGGIGFSFINSQPEICLAAALTGGSLLASFFLPFYLNNMEAIYEKYREEFNLSVKNISRMIMTSIESNIQDNIDEMEKLKKQLEEENLIQDDPEQDKEKDPDDTES